jgi:post-segregation antitoxin (ccd killing protein)
MGRFVDKEMRLRNATAEEKAERRNAMWQWRHENRAAIASWNRWIKENGMPYSEYREF